MDSAEPPKLKYFWGNSPEPDKFYASHGLVHGDSYFPTPHGRLFTQSFIPATAASGDGESPAAVKGVVFMSHGYGSDASWMFQTIAITYATWGYAVYTADLLGHGRSDGVRCYMGDMEAVAGASLSFFLSVRRSPAYAALPAFLFGESMGGAATLLMYLRSPSPAPPPSGDWTGVILSAPLLQIPASLYPSRLRLFLFGLLFGLADTWPAMGNPKMVGKAVRDLDRMKIIAANPNLYRGQRRVGTMRELARVTAYLREHASEVVVPLLALHGTDDTLADIDGTRILYEKAKSDDKEFIVYEGMYHSLLQGESEENRNRVFGDLRRWIDDRVQRYSAAIAAVAATLNRKDETTK